MSASGVMREEVSERCVREGCYDTLSSSPARGYVRRCVCHERVRDDKTVYDSV